MNSLLRVSGVLVTVLLGFSVSLAAADDDGRASVNFTFRKKPAPPPVPSVPEPVLEQQEPIVEPLPIIEPPPQEELPAAEPAAEPEPVAEEAGGPAVNFTHAEEPAPEPVLVPPPATEAIPVVTELVPPVETTWVEEQHSHPSAQGLQFHEIDFPEPLPIRATQMILQTVWLDPQDPPRGIAMEFKRADDEGAGVYWEGEEEVFNPAQYQDLWYYGLLPELDQWAVLEILAEDLGMEDARVAGIRFITFGGRSLWGKTSVKEAPPLEPEEPEDAPAVSSNSVSAGPS